MLRQLKKNKVFTLINLLGLATGMATCLLLLLYIQNELGFDNFLPNADQIQRIELERKYPTRSAFRAGIPQTIGEAVKADIPGVLATTHIQTFGPEEGMRITAGEKSFVDKRCYFADSSFFQVFPCPFIEGGPGALQKPWTVVLNESTARRYFSSPANALGKALRFNDGGKDFIVTGVIRDWPEKTHLPFNILVSTAGMEWTQEKQYVYFGPFTYIRLDKTTSPAAVEAQLPRVVDKYVAPVVPGLFGESWKQFLAEGNGYHYYLLPLKDIHLHSIDEDELRPAVSARNLLALACIAAFILLLAGVNFINLSTALAVQRAREVGIRKTFGSRRPELIRQFLTESLAFSLVSVMLALLLTVLFTPLLNGLSGQQLSPWFYWQPLRLLLAVGFGLLIGIVAGLYPAFVMSSFDPMEVLKGRFKSSRRGILLRNGLVVFQFAISVILIVCTIVVNRQMQYVLGNSLGFRQDHIISVDQVWRLRTAKKVDGRIVETDNRQAFINGLATIPGVESTSKCSYLPGADEMVGGYTFMTYDGRTSRTDRMIEADDNYLDLLGLQLSAGRFFTKTMATDSLAVVLNEAAVADFGLRNPIGARLFSKEAAFDSSGGKRNVFTVIGVVKDFHHQSMHRTIAPLIFLNADRFFWGSVAVRVRGDGFKTTLTAMQQLWHRMDPKSDLRFAFLDQQVAALYKIEKMQQEIFTLFSSLAILIACVGLLGLSTFAIRQRTKEISIRKVLGAMPGNIILILSTDFLLLIGIAALVAFPLAWWAMHAWLQNFAYRVGIEWWIFLLAASLAAAIAMLTIAWQAVRAALTNPINNLRSE